MSKENGIKQKKRKWPLILAVLLLAVIIAVIIFMVSGRRRTADEDLEASAQEAFIGNITVTAEGSGSVEAASTKALALEYDGKLETIYVEAGDEVQQGDVLAVYDTEALDTVIDTKEEELEQVNSSIASLDDSGSSVITAPVSGRVKRIFASVGDVAANVVERNGGVAEISADGRLKVEFTCADSTLSEGDSVTVEFDSYSVPGTVEEISGDQVCVTIEDDTEYMVDTAATVRGKSGAVLGEGILLSNHPYLVQASYGIIDSVNVTRETYVNAGDTMFERSDAQYNETYLDLLSDREELVDELQEVKEYQKNPVVVSEYDGYIVSLDVMEGMTYEKDQQFCTIADEETLSLKVEIDELEIDGVEVGQTAEVVFDAFEDETYTGTVEKISGLGNNTGGVATYTVTIEMEGDTRLKNAMSATAKITTQSKDNVLLVPVEAVQSVDGEHYVQVVRDGEAVQTPVTIGLVNAEYAEVTEGLSSGDRVLAETAASQDLFSSIMQQRQSMVAGTQE